jgi:hypothetical protein
MRQLLGMLRKADSGQLLDWALARHHLERIKGGKHPS